jgi:hypothetical protein
MYTNNDIIKCDNISRFYTESRYPLTQLNSDNKRSKSVKKLYVDKNAS